MRKKCEGWMFMVNVGKNTSPMDAYEEEIQVEGDNSSF